MCDSLLIFGMHHDSRGVRALGESEIECGTPCACGCGFITAGRAAKCKMYGLHPQGHIQGLQGGLWRNARAGAGGVTARVKLLHALYKDQRATSSRRQPSIHTSCVQEVTFQYTGYNESGTVIDSSYRQDRPAQTQLGVGGLIPGGCGGSHTKWVWGYSYIYRVCWPERPPPAALDPQGPTSGFLPVTQSVLLLPFTGFDLALRTMRVGTQRRFIVPPALGPPVGPSTFFSAKQCEVRASSLEEQRSLYIGRVCRPPILRTGNKCGMAQ